MAEKPTYEELEQRLSACEQNAKDLTRGEESLRNGEAKYRALVESLERDYVIYSHDSEGVFTYLSPSIFTVLGYTPEEFIGHYTEYMTDNPINQKAMEYTMAALRGEKQSPYESEFYHKNGTRCYLRATEVPVLDEQGNVLGVEGIVQDITEQKRLETQSGELIERLQRALLKSKTQGTLIPMCAGCKRVKDENDRWQHIEVYVMEHTDLSFTHGHCPECHQRMMDSIPPANNK